MAKSGIDIAIESLKSFATDSPLSFMAAIFAIMLLMYAIFPSLRTGGRSGTTLTIILGLVGLPLLAVAFLQLTKSPALQELLQTSDEGVMIVGTVFIGSTVLGAVLFMGLVIPITFAIALSLAGRRSRPGVG